ncbi:MAG: 3-dehydroquinate synthase [Spirochaetaceae bacterium]|jgi:3-dehydroquinate synthase|nr:3-dehydroquinate synthase [Spirochaetaceae bacterium]
MSASYHYTFKIGCKETSVHLQRDFPSLEDVLRDAQAAPGTAALVVCDANTEAIARTVAANADAPVCVLEAGEKAKTLDSVVTVLMAAKNAGLGRDGVIVAVGGGVLSDLAAFAASCYMRGCALAIVSTTLLGMADAAVGGKSGVDFDGIKNFAGAFYPARSVFMPLAALRTLPEREMKSGFAEVLKTAVLGGYEDLFARAELPADADNANDYEAFAPLLARTVAYKGKTVEEDPEERSGKRALLNLGHTFGHALETVAGLGELTHGEAVAWGTARACSLGVSLGVTPPARAAKITALLERFGYETRARHPAIGDYDSFVRAMRSDKKKKGGRLVFVLPDGTSAVCRSAETDAIALKWAMPI